MANGRRWKRPSNRLPSKAKHRSPSACVARPMARSSTTCLAPLPGPRQSPCGGRSWKPKTRSSTVSTSSTAPIPWARCARPRPRCMRQGLTWCGPMPVAISAGGRRRSCRSAPTASTPRSSLTVQVRRPTSSASIPSASTHSRRTRRAATLSRPTTSLRRRCRSPVTTTCRTEVASSIATWPTPG